MSISMWGKAALYQPQTRMKKQSRG